MFKKLTEQEQIRIERAKSLEYQNTRDEMDKIYLQHLIDLDFQQSLSKLGV